MDLKTINLDENYYRHDVALFIVQYLITPQQRRTTLCTSDTWLADLVIMKMREYGYSLVEFENFNYYFERVRVGKL